MLACIWSSSYLVELVDGGVDQVEKKTQIESYLVQRQAQVDTDLPDRVTDIGHDFTPDRI